MKYFCFCKFVWLKLLYTFRGSNSAWRSMMENFNKSHRIPSIKVKIWMEKFWSFFFFLKDEFWRSWSWLMVMIVTSTSLMKKFIYYESQLCTFHIYQKKMLYNLFINYFMLVSFQFRFVVCVNFLKKFLCRYRLAPWLLVQQFFTSLIVS